MTPIPPGATLASRCLRGSVLQCTASPIFRESRDNAAAAPLISTYFFAPAAKQALRGLIMTQYVYRFGGGVSDGGKGDKFLLGGKGANLAEMASIGLPVPPGFTIATPACALYYEKGDSFRDTLAAEVAEGIAHIEQVTGRRFGDPADPLLVSVRSGARVSMPG